MRAPGTRLAGSLVCVAAQAIARSLRAFGVGISDHSRPFSSRPPAFEDGTDAGDATYAVMIKPGEEILVGNSRRFRVLDVVPFEEEDESPFVGRLRVEAR